MRILVVLVFNCLQMISDIKSLIFSIYRVELRFGVWWREDAELAVSKSLWPHRRWQKTTWVAILNLMRKGRVHSLTYSLYTFLSALALSSSLFHFLFSGNEKSQLSKSESPSFPASRLLAACRSIPVFRERAPAFKASQLIMPPKDAVW